MTKNKEEKYEIKEMKTRKRKWLSKMKSDWIKGGEEEVGERHKWGMRGKGSERWEWLGEEQRVKKGGTGERRVNKKGIKQRGMR